MRAGSEAPRVTRTETWGPDTPMTAITARPYTAADTMRWAALALVFGAAMLNYMDRQALALLKPQLEVEFGSSDPDYAHINSDSGLRPSARCWRWDGSSTASGCGRDTPSASAGGVSPR